MQKKIKVLISIIIVISFVIISKKYYDLIKLPSREILILKLENINKSNVIISFNDYKNQHEIDLFEVILLESRNIKDQKIDKLPNYQIYINSPREGTSLSVYNLWFINDICIIAPKNEANAEGNYKEINSENTKILKEMMKLN
ncbi:MULTISPECIES: hypothetical protein [Romboutsia]|uniref:hypothetical protein n=1 Tax=Romboutsia TaxID=1501226 RepID=UPI00216E5A61|nr:MULTISPECIES: hypothetical protein [Romboutsia]MCI9258797.1 hypothetical protein [Romboutsia sp.]